jgi:hypothetical protein
MEYSTPQPDAPPAVATAAVEYPAGHAMPGEYRPQPIITPGSKCAWSPDRGDQQSVKSCALLTGLHVWPCHTVVQVSHSAIAYEQMGGAVHVVVSGPRRVRGEGVDIWLRGIKSVGVSNLCV